MATPGRTEWSLGQLWGWGVAAAISAGGAGAAVAALTHDPASASFVYTIVISGIGNAASGFGGGAGGYWLSYNLDAPVGELQVFKRSFLFGLVFTLLIYALLSFPNIAFLKANPQIHLLYGTIVAFISGLIAAGLKGVLNNLKTEDRRRG
jgi:hypothetical protein